MLWCCFSRASSLGRQGDQQGPLLSRAVPLQPSRMRGETVRVQSTTLLLVHCPTLYKQCQSKHAIHTQISLANQALLLKFFWFMVPLVTAKNQIFQVFSTLQKKIPRKLSLFLVGAFSLKEKSPTITLGSFFSADNLTLNGPLFLQFLQSYNFSISYNS